MASNVLYLLNWFEILHPNTSQEYPSNHRNILGWWVKFGILMCPIYRKVPMFGDHSRTLEWSSRQLVKMICNNGTQIFNELLHDTYVVTFRESFWDTNVSRFWLSTGLALIEIRVCKENKLDFFLLHNEYAIWKITKNYLELSLRVNFRILMCPICLISNH